MNTFVAVWIFVVGCGIFSWLVWCIAHGLSNRQRRVKHRKEEDVGKFLKRKLKLIRGAWWLDEEEKAAAVRHLIDKVRHKWLV